MLTIEPIKDIDIKDCLDIYNHYIENTTVSFEIDKLSLRDFKKRVHRINARFPYIVAKLDGVVVGYAYLDKYAERKAYDISVDLSIYVHKDYLNQHIGSALYLIIENKARELGYHNIISIVTSENENSLKWHVSQGFVQEGYLTDVAYKHGKYLGTYMLKKALK